MEFLTLNTGAQLPMIGFGTWGVRGEGGKRSILDALELGYRLVDTALMYKKPRHGRGCPAGKRPTPRRIIPHHQIKPPLQQLSGRQGGH